MKPSRAILLVAALWVGHACAPAVPPPAATPPPAEAEPDLRPPVDTRTPVRLGVLLPAGGPAYLQPWADAVAEGVAVAVAERAADERFRVEVVTRPAGTPQQAASAARELAAAGVVAIVAPLQDEDVARVAAARPDTALPILAPLAAASFGGLSQVYALNVPDTLGARALGEYAARRSAGPIGVLRTRTPASLAQARAFSAGVAAAGGRAPVEVTYDPGTTTFGAPLRRLRDAGVRSLFVAAEERDIRQILPQVDYYGLESAQVLATGSWSTPDGLERIGLGVLDGVLVTLPFLPDEPGGGWERFQQAYEAQFRRSLENPVPALGYDAARLALAGLARQGSAAEVAAALRAGTEVAGATGRLRAAYGSVLRRPLIVRVSDGRLDPVAAMEP